MTTQGNGAPTPPSSIESINEPPGSEVLPEPKPKRKKSKKKKAKKAKKAKSKTKKTVKAKKKKL